MTEQRIGKMNRAVNRLLDLPMEFALDLPKLVLLGNRQLYIENHQGISFYQNDKITISCNEGAIVVEGEDLMLKNISQDELCIDGRIRCVRYAGSDEV